MKMESDNFYKEEYHRLLIEDLKKISEKLDANTAEIAKINAKFSYIFGMAAGITVIVNIVWVFFKEKIFRI